MVQVIITIRVMISLVVILSAMKVKTLKQRFFYLKFLHFKSSYIDPSPYNKDYAPPQTILTSKRRPIALENLFLIIISYYPQIA